MKTQVAEVVPFTTNMYEPPSLRFQRLKVPQLKFVYCILPLRKSIFDAEFRMLGPVKMVPATSKALRGFVVQTPKRPDVSRVIETTLLVLKFKLLLSLVPIVAAALKLFPPLIIAKEFTSTLEIVLNEGVPLLLTGAAKKVFCERLANVSCESVIAMLWH